MDRDMEANTRCTWFTQIGYVHGVEEFSLIVKGLHKYIGSSSPLHVEKFMEIFDTIWISWITQLIGLHHNGALKMEYLFKLQRFFPFT
ncbi:hypothetical protein DVH24_018904 [Malus domestica]|uniref:Uncharacterized protein n=1 Tax=Malus domestica TaxID=3750 RepID=A0A498HKV3_MALDO|nr:hypothetical protein DVH24_018904 [Malus domestica]